MPLNVEKVQLLITKLIDLKFSIFDIYHTIPNIIEQINLEYALHVGSKNKTIHKN